MFRNVVVDGLNDIEDREMEVAVKGWLYYVNASVQIYRLETGISDKYLEELKVTWTSILHTRKNSGPPSQKKQFSFASKDFFFEKRQRKDNALWKDEMWDEIVKWRNIM